MEIGLMVLVMTMTNTMKPGNDLQAIAKKIFDEESGTQFLF
jgi:hypothetical protein